MTGAGIHRAAPKLPLRHAIALGLLHGPAELLPVSSSAHTTLVPWLAGWSYDELDPELRKAFEVALHAGTAAALLAHPPWSSTARQCPSGSKTGRQPACAGGPRVVFARFRFLAGALMPPALTGYALGGQIERRLGTPATIAAGLVAGSVAMSAVEILSRGGSPGRTRGAGLFRTLRSHPAAATRPPASAGLRDGLALGVAQSLALAPGLSRSAGTLAAARARGFSRLDADRLSWTVGLPVIAGATLLKGSRLAREGVAAQLRLPFAAGAIGAFFSTLISTRIVCPRRRAALLPACAAYRGALALLVIRRMRDKQVQACSPYPKK